MSRSARIAVVSASVAALLGILFTLSLEPVKNNVCRTINDYYTLNNNPNCWYDPDVHSNATQIINNHGYGSETHEIVSKDGQILTLYRIVNKSAKNKAKSKGPIFLQHGLTASSISFLGIGNESLPFLLANAGYDVWLGNSRGTIYSWKHTKYSADKDPEFWDYSFDEMGTYDIPATIKYVRKFSEEKLIYIGYSVGTAQALIYASTFPEESEANVKMFVFMSPVIANKNPEGFVYKILAPTLAKLNKLLPKGFVDLYLDPTGKFNRMELPLVPMFLQIKLIAPIMRYYRLLDIDSIKPETFPKVIAHNGHGASTKSMVHLFNNFTQLRKFDYGPEENLKIYGQEAPSKYNVDKIKIPVHMFYSDGDGIASTKDALEIYNTLPEKSRKGFHKVPFDKFTHNDFIYGANVKEYVYDRILEILKMA